MKRRQSSSNQQLKIYCIIICVFNCGVDARLGSLVLVVLVMVEMLVGQIIDTKVNYTNPPQYYVIFYVQFSGVTPNHPSSHVQNLVTTNSILIFLLQCKTDHVYSSDRLENSKFDHSKCNAEFVQASSAIISQ